MDSKIYSFSTFIAPFSGRGHPRPWRRWRKHSKIVHFALVGETPIPICRLRAEGPAAVPQKGGTMDKHKHQMHFELTQEEFDLLSKSAKQCGLSRRAYVVRLIEGTPIQARPSEEIKKLRTEIHHIGNNINQIARSVNAGIAKKEDAQRGLALLEQVYSLLYDYIDP